MCEVNEGSTNKCLRKDNAQDASHSGTPAGRCDIYVRVRKHAPRSLSLGERSDSEIELPACATLIPEAEKTGETPIILTILEARWRLFGPILRQAINTPPNVAMTNYFKTEGSKRRGRPKTSIVTTLRRDLKSHWSTRLYSIKDLDHLLDISQNRSDWKHLTTAIYRSAQVETPVDVAADGHKVKLS
ncbi:hypothetical protein ElyMa_000599400 [Elysia marginata]|uniref:Uncharacterized protein n=1 Tax=Elysia marginata TaxID=1093978 RepID=A0AAV4G7E9_9GAST|nr:hypothetical protein ElyMa_000599400 [Elysia marginata]